MAGLAAAAPVVANVVDAAGAAVGLGAPKLNAVEVAEAGAADAPNDSGVDAGAVSAIGAISCARNIQRKYSADIPDVDVDEGAGAAAGAPPNNEGVDTGVLATGFGAPKERVGAVDAAAVDQYKRMSMRSHTWPSCTDQREWGQPKLQEQKLPVHQRERGPRGQLVPRVSPDWHAKNKE